MDPNDRIPERIRTHCAALNQCNQRGGRMLSVLDLLDAGTLDLNLAAFLMAHVSRGVSFLVGARPGGAGKTTVMGAVLNLVPADITLVAADSRAVREAEQCKNAARRCYVCHEIGVGHWFAYLWGADLRAYCALHRRGHMLAANLHADDVEEAHRQICGGNGVREEDFRAFRLLIFLRVGRGASPRRWIEKVYLAEGEQPHRLVFDASAPLLRMDTAPGDGWQAECRSFLENTLKAPARTVESVRAAVLEFMRGPR